MWLPREPWFHCESQQVPSQPVSGAPVHRNTFQYEVGKGVSSTAATTTSQVSSWDSPGSSVSFRKGLVESSGGHVRLPVFGSLDSQASLPSSLSSASTLEPEVPGLQRPGFCVCRNFSAASVVVAAGEPNKRGALGPSVTLTAKASPWGLLGHFQDSFFSRVLVTCVKLDDFDLEGIGGSIQSSSTLCPSSQQKVCSDQNRQSSAPNLSKSFGRTCSPHLADQIERQMLVTLGLFFRGGYF